MSIREGLRKISIFMSLIEEMKHIAAFLNSSCF